jgi:hypothetical protein
MADCDIDDNTRVSGCSGVSLPFLGVRESASTFQARVVYASSAAIDA